MQPSDIDWILLLILLILLALLVYIARNYNTWLAWRRERAVRKVLPCSLTDPLGPLPQGMEPVELAAWTVVGNVLLNLDEMFAKR